MSETIQNVSVVNNRQVSVWRGTDEPPTIHHVWLQSSRILKIWLNDLWEEFTTDPGFDLTQIDTNTVEIGQLDSKFSLKVASTNNALTITTNNNVITLTTNALTTINTDNYLDYTDDTLSIKNTGVTEGLYGPANSIASNTFNIPKFTVNKKGLITSADTMTVNVPNHVDLPLLESTDEKDYPLLLGNSDGNSPGSAVRTDKVSYNAKKEQLLIDASGGIAVTGGNITVAEGHNFVGNLLGDISGTAKPTAHASYNMEFGAGSHQTFGHVILLDNFVTDLFGIVAPKDSGVSVAYDTSSEDLEISVVNGGNGVAASPKMVYDVYKNLSNKIDTTKSNLQLEMRNYFGEDFEVSNNIALIAWDEMVASTTT